MADVVVAGAAGRMGSRLVALLQQETELRLVAALEAPGHPALGRDAGESAGVGRLGVPIAADVEAALGRDRILIEFSVPEASLAHARLVGRHGGRAVIGTTGLHRRPARGARRHRPRRAPARLPQHERGGQRRLQGPGRHGPDARRRLRRGDRRDPPPVQEGRAERHRAADGRGGGPGARARSRHRRGLRPARPAGRADPQGDRHGRPALRRRGGRAHRVLRLARRAARADPPRPQPGQLRARRAARGPLHRDRAPRPLLHAGRARAAS